MGVRLRDAQSGAETLFGFFRLFGGLLIGFLLLRVLLAIGRNELAAWQAGQGNALVVQLKAGGLGVDLTRAHYQIYFSLDYNLGDYLQTRKRIHRPGQTRAVTYLHMIAAGTVDHAVYAALAKREEVATSVLAGLRRR